MEINKDTLMPFLIYSKPIKYNENITLYPVTMNDILLFQSLYQSIILRKNSIFHEKKIIKMTYLDFLLYSLNDLRLEEQYKISGLSNYYVWAIQLLQLCCKDSEIRINQENGAFWINNEFITPQIFDDLRRIIIIQNGIDFDIDEFINYDTEQKLLKSGKQKESDEYKAYIEDYIDSLVLAMNVSESAIMNMSVRKFWRYIKRYQSHERYTIAKTGECSGMVTFKEPIKHWMLSLDEEDKFRYLKTDENELKGKIG